MLASISPLGERARGNRWGRTVTAYTVASIGAAAVLGAALGLVGRLAGVPSTAALVTLAVVAVAAGGADLAFAGRLPSVHRQVNEDWLGRYRGWIYGAGFGAQLALGVVTIVTTATVYAWMAAAVLAGSPTAGALVGAAFGLARALPLGFVHRVTTPVDLRARLRRMTDAAAAARVTVAGAAIAIGVAAGLGAAAGVRA